MKNILTIFILYNRELEDAAIYREYKKDKQKKYILLKKLHSETLLISSKKI